MNNPRRKFLKLSALFGAGAALMPLQFCTPAKSAAGNNQLSKFGIQLYSVKDEMAKDAKGTMRKLAADGYKQFEGFDGGKGILWGMEPKEFKSFTSDLGVKMVSTHANVFENLDQQAADAKVAGLEYLICPWIGGQKSIDDYKKFADRFNDAGKTLKSNGLKFAYHNHDYTFKTMDGVLPQDVLMDETDASLVDFEMDMYWVYVAGIDPADYLAKYPNRFKLCHLKDAGTDEGDPGERGVLLGKGEIPYADLIRQSKPLGMEYFIVEQERFVGTNPLDAASKNAVYLENLRF